MHAENGGVIDVLVKKALAAKHTAPKWHALTRPPEAEGEATGRAFKLAEMAGGVPLYIVHLSARAGARAGAAVPGPRPARRTPRRARSISSSRIRQLRRARIRRREVRHDPAAAREVAPGRALEGPAEERPAGRLHGPLPVLHEGGLQGLPKQKELGNGDFSKIPNGAPGVETRMALLFDGGVAQGRITRNRWVELTSTAPAKIMGLFPSKGTIAVGSDADIVVWDPKATQTLSAKTHHMRVDYNPYEGRKVKGRATVVLSRGEVIVDGKFLGKKGRGRFLKRGSPLLQT